MNIKTGNLSKLGNEWDDERRPPYAILSHRWEEQEVSYQEWESGEYERKSSGYRKIGNCGKLASSRDIGRVWIDTCCIDKKIGAELSEAINSMHKWYKMAQECHIYLNDVVWDVYNSSAEAKS